MYSVLFRWPKNHTTSFWDLTNYGSQDIVEPDTELTSAFALHIGGNCSIKIQVCNSLKLWFYFILDDKDAIGKKREEILKERRMSKLAVGARENCVARKALNFTSALELDAVNIQTLAFATKTSVSNKSVPCEIDAANLVIHP